MAAMEALKKGQGSSSFKVCLVCGDKAIARNYGAVSCPSCKAFFRRNALRELWGRCYGGCMITVATRNFCKHCRLRKCLSVGMRPELILDDKQKMERKMKLMERKQTLAKETSSNDMKQEMQTNLVGYQTEQHYGYPPNRNDVSQPTNQYPPLDSLGVTREDCQGTFHVMPAGNQTAQCQPLDTQKSMEIDFDMYDQAGRLEPNASSQGTQLFQDNYNREQTLSVGSSSTSGSSPSGSQANPLSPFPNQKGINTYSPPFAGTATVKTENSLLSPTVGRDPLADTAKAEKDGCTPQDDTEKKKKHPKDGLVKIQIPGRISEQLTRVYADSNFSENLKEIIKELSSAYEASYDYYLPADIKPSPSPLEFINMADKSVRRLVKFAKKLHLFRELGQDDQIILLKGCVVEVMILRSVFFFDPDNKGWKVDHASHVSGLGTAHISAESLDQFPVGHNMKTMFQEYMLFVKGLMEVLQTDELALLYMTAMSIFADDRPGLKKKDAISEIYNTYSNTLQTYLKVAYPMGNIKFEDLLQKLREIRQLNDVVSNLMMKEKVENIEPLMVEMFNLTP